MPSEQHDYYVRVRFKGNLSKEVSADSPEDAMKRVGEQAKCLIAALRKLGFEYEDGSIDVTGYDDTTISREG